MQVNQQRARLARGRSDRYHLVQLEVRESFQRPAPASGVRTVNIRLTVAVPVELEKAALVLRPGNHIQVEYAVLEVGNFLPDTHYALQAVPAEERDRLHRRARTYLVVTAIHPCEGTVPLRIEEQTKITRRQQITGKQRARSHRQPLT